MNEISRPNNSTRAVQDKERKSAERYLILAASVPNVLMNLVNDAMEDGFRPTGGVMVDSRDGLFYQALFRNR